MSTTPGRKRIQPIPIEDDDEPELTTTADDVLVASSSSSIAVKDIVPVCQTPVPKKNIYVALHFDELSHIRNAQTNGEFATVLYDFKLYKDVVNGHICFSCRKVRFFFLQPGTRCTICRQRVCSKCQRQMNYCQDKICFVSLNLLRRSSITATPSFANPLTLGRNQRTDSESSSFTTKPCQTQDRQARSRSSFSCCIDCFILFDPTSLV